MSSTFSIGINFSTLGMLRRLHRLNILLTLRSSSQDLIGFPNVDRHHNKEGQNKLPKVDLSTIKDEGISEAVQKAKTKARSTLEALGMDKLLRFTPYGTMRVPQIIYLLKETHQMIMAMMMMTMTTLISVI